MDMDQAETAKGIMSMIRHVKRRSILRWCNGMTLSPQFSECTLEDTVAARGRCGASMMAVVF